MRTPDAAVTAANHPSTGNAGTSFTATPREFGVGARLTLAVMADDYVDVISGRCGTPTPPGSRCRPGKSAPTSRRRTGRAALSEPGDSGGRPQRSTHVGRGRALSRGCPGGVSCEIPEGGAALYSEIPELEPTGISTGGRLGDLPARRRRTGSAAADHMRDIYAAIDYAKSTGVTVTEDHYVTRLDGTSPRSCRPSPRGGS